MHAVAWVEGMTTTRYTVTHEIYHLVSTTILGKYMYYKVPLREVPSGVAQERNNDSYQV